MTTYDRPKTDAEKDVLAVAAELVRTKWVEDVPDWLAEKMAQWAVRLRNFDDEWIATHKVTSIQTTIHLKGGPWDGKTYEVERVVGPLLLGRCEAASYDEAGNLIQECDRTDYEVVNLPDGDTVRLCADHLADADRREEIEVLGVCELCGGFVNEVDDCYMDPEGYCHQTCINKWCEEEHE